MMGLGQILSLFLDCMFLLSSGVSKYPSFTLLSTLSFNMISIEVFSVSGDIACNFD